MTGGQIAGVGIVAGIVYLIFASMGLSTAERACRRVGPARRISRGAYALRVLGLKLGFYFGMVLAFAGAASGALDGLGSLWGYCVYRTAKWSAKRLNDAGSTNRNLAALTSLPFVGNLFVLYLAVLPPAEPSP